MLSKIDFVSFIKLCMGQMCPVSSREKLLSSFSIFSSLEMWLGWLLTESSCRKIVLYIVSSFFILEVFFCSPVCHYFKKLGVRTGTWPNWAQFCNQPAGDSWLWILEMVTFGWTDFQSCVKGVRGGYSVGHIHVNAPSDLQLLHGQAHIWGSSWEFWLFYKVDTLFEKAHFSR